MADTGAAETVRWPGPQGQLAAGWRL